MSTKPFPSSSPKLNSSRSLSQSSSPEEKETKNSTDTMPRDKTKSKEKFLKLPSFSIQIIISLVVGIILGWIALKIGPHKDQSPNALMVILDTIATSFVTLLRAIVPPLILTAIIASVVNLQGVKNAARLAAKTILWFAITSFIAVSVGIALGVILRPGVQTSVAAELAKEPAKVGSWLDFLKGIIPSNYLGVGASTNITDNVATTTLGFDALQIIVIAFAIGIAALKVGESAQSFIDFNKAALKIVQKILWWIIRLAPIGTVGLIGRAIATYGWGSLSSLATYTFTIYLGLAIVLFLVYPTILALNKLSISAFFKSTWPALQLAFVSRSSMGTMPVTERITHESLGVPREYTSFAVPLGATTKMDGCAAIYPAVSAIFVAQFFGVHLSLSDYLLIIVVAVFGSAATAGVTGAIVMLTLTLSTLNLPLEGVGLLLAIDPILDMGRTAVNVAGQMLVPSVVAKREGILDENRYREHRQINLDA